MVETKVDNVQPPIAKVGVVVGCLKIRRIPIVPLSAIHSGLGQSVKVAARHAAIGREAFGADQAIAGGFGKGGFVRVGLLA